MISRESQGRAVAVLVTDAIYLIASFILSDFVLDE